MSDPSLKVALYTGNYVARDAISDSLRQKVEAFDDLPAKRVEVTVFTHGSEITDPRIRSCPTVRDVLCHPAFWDADLHVFEFGVYYDLFDVAFMVPAGRPLLAVYHNITPVELVEGDAVKQTIARSLVQKNNLHLMSEVTCDSEYNRNDLIDFGIPADLTSVLHLPPPRAAKRKPSTSRTGGETTELVYVGRFVPSKGIIDLLDVLRRLVDSDVENFHITMIGSLRYSDPRVVDELRDALASPDLGPRITLLPDASDEELHTALTRADALVIPSYHEGFCVPVIEAYLADCHVLGYDSTNLPFITGGLGRLVETGNVEALTQAVTEFIAMVAADDSGDRGAYVVTDSGRLTHDAWRERIDTHLEDYTLSRFRSRFFALVAKLTGVDPAGAEKIRPSAPG